MKIQITSSAIITDCNPGTLAEIRNRLSFKNPAWLENERFGFSNYKTNPVLECFHIAPGGLSFPRGFTGNAIRIAKRHGEQITVVDNRSELPEVDFTFTGTLKPFQKYAVEDITTKPFGVLQAITGSGKTVMALSVIAARKQPALIVVHTKELLHQWSKQIETFLGIPAEEIGVIGGGKMRIGAKITVALVQSLVKYADDVYEHVGFLVVDECHRAPSRTFTDVVTKFDCRYQLGLSATPYRRDQLTRLIWFYIGDKVHEVDQQGLVDAGDISRAEVVTIQTDYQTRLDPTTEYSKMLSQLCDDKARNKLVAQHAAGEANGNGGIALVLSDTKSHVNVLQSILSNMGVLSDVLTGDTSNGNRKALFVKIKAGDVRILIATGQLVGEGFDLPEISSVILATPLKFSGRLIQYIGRALRPSPGTDCARIIDFYDARVSVLAAGARSRLRTFMGMPGVTIAAEHTHA